VHGRADALGQHPVQALLHQPAIVVHVPRV
jgi:hypothetical protein